MGKHRCSRLRPSDNAMFGGNSNWRGRSGCRPTCLFSVPCYRPRRRKESNPCFGPGRKRRSGRIRPRHFFLGARWPAVYPDQCDRFIQGNYLADFNSPVPDQRMLQAVRIPQMGSIRLPLGPPEIPRSTERLLPFQRPIVIPRIISAWLAACGAKKEIGA